MEKIITRKWLELIYYTNTMLPAHTLLELRTGRDSTHTPEAAAQLFASLPQLKNQWWYRFMGINESLSFELVVENQSIFFLCHAPTRLVGYLRSSLSASYPEVLISELPLDPIETLINAHDSYVGERSQAVALGTLKLKNHEYLPLKTYHDFKQVDPIAPLLSLLSKLSEYERVIIQFLTDTDSENWKARSTPSTTDTPHPQQALIAKKMAPGSVLVGVKVMVTAETHEQAQLILESVGSSLKGLSETGGNTLELS
ncbi:hypothetical protein KBC79_06035, partial [Candidatus Woesebacteria bacterium]|nr:hypothetical protein [Candidatus Woesebacteria bacterium]